jgi:hypothetical protein
MIQKWTPERVAQWKEKLRETPLSYSADVGDEFLSLLEAYEEAVARLEICRSALAAETARDPWARNTQPPGA